MYTYEHACSIKKFISLLAKNEKLKEIIIPNFNKLESILADPECEFTKKLKINYDLIEVSNSWCFSLSRRAFVLNPIKEIGVASPRAFLHYAHTKEPEAKYFQEILENSLIKPDSSGILLRKLLAPSKCRNKATRRKSDVLNWRAKQR